MTDTVLYESRGPVAILTLNRPDQRNSVNVELANALRAALARFEADAAARIAILTGAGHVFSAGMDLKAFLDGDGDAIIFGEGRFAGFIDAPRTKPVIAAVNGPALAGGFELALACDLIVASDTAFFGLPEPGVGIFACAGGPFRLARKIPPAKALELALTADRLGAAEAHALGLVNRLSPPDQVLATALDLAERILRNAPQRRHGHARAPARPGRQRPNVTSGRSTTVSGKMSLLRKTPSKARAPSPKNAGPSGPEARPRPSPGRRPSARRWPE